MVSFESNVVRRENGCEYSSASAWLVNGGRIERLRVAQPGTGTLGRSPPRNSETDRSTLCNAKALASSALKTSADNILNES